MGNVGKPVDKSTMSKLGRNIINAFSGEALNKGNVQGEFAGTPLQRANTALAKSMKDVGPPQHKDREQQLADERLPDGFSVPGGKVIAEPVDETGETIQKAGDLLGDANSPVSAVEVTTPKGVNVKLAGDSPAQIQSLATEGVGSKLGTPNTQGSDINAPKAGEVADLNTPTPILNFADAENEISARREGGEVAPLAGDFLASANPATPGLGGTLGGLLSDPSIQLALAGFGKALAPKGTNIGLLGDLGMQLATNNAAKQYEDELRRGKKAEDLTDPAYSILSAEQKAQAEKNILGEGQTKAVTADLTARSETYLTADQKITQAGVEAGLTQQKINLMKAGQKYMDIGQSKVFNIEDGTMQDFGWEFAKDIGYGAENLNRGWFKDTFKMAAQEASVARYLKGGQLRYDANDKPILEWADPIKGAAAFREEHRRQVQILVDNGTIAPALLRMVPRLVVGTPEGQQLGLYEEVYDTTGNVIDYKFKAPYTIKGKK